MARTAKQKAALRKAQLASARKRRKGGRKKKSPGRIYNAGNDYVRRGKSRGNRIARGVALGTAVAYTPYGYAYLGSGVRKAVKGRKKKRRR